MAIDTQFSYPSVDRGDRLCVVLMWLTKPLFKPVKVGEPFGCLCRALRDKCDYYISTSCAHIFTVHHFVAFLHVERKEDGNRSSCMSYCCGGPTLCGMFWGGAFLMVVAVYSRAFDGKQGG